MKSYTIGTRGSLLALTQCGQIKRQLEALTGHQFHLKILKTQGDQITNAPLWQLEGKDFFTKELDEALLAKEVDLVVHSYKDLGSIRPPNIELAAITERFFGEDILLVKKSTIKKMREGSLQNFSVGTSSPRRMYNLKKYLGDYLPKSSTQNVLPIEIRMLRGNVNSRLKKMIDGEFDGVVLALPGLERLALEISPRSTNHSSSELIGQIQNDITQLLTDLDFMILPQSQLPSAAAQGALGIECLTSNHELKALLKKLHHQPTADAIGEERTYFKNYGGGCHLPIGIHVKKFEDYYLHFHRGEYQGKEFSLEKMTRTDGEGLILPQFVAPPKMFIGLPQKKLHSILQENRIELPHSGQILGDFLITKQSLPLQFPQTFAEKILYITGKNTFHGLKTLSSTNAIEDKWIFTAGAKTMRELASLGYWVNGTSDGLGDNEYLKFFQSEFLQLLYRSNTNAQNNAYQTLVLSHDRAHSRLGTTLPTYTHIIQELDSSKKIHIEKDFMKYDLYYWTSFTQYSIYSAQFPELKFKKHVSGLGKTFFQLKEQKLDVTPVSSLRSLLKNYY